MLLALGLTLLITSCSGVGAPGSARSHGSRLAPPSLPAPRAHTSGPVSAAWLATAIQQVTAGSPHFGLRDSTGAPMQTLKVVPSASFGYLGVYHCVKDGRFEVRLATSTTLRTWAFRAVLDTHASQPTLARAPNGGYVLAVEADNRAGPGPGRRFLRLRYYPNVSALSSGHAARTFVAAHTLAGIGRGAEGTPNIYSVRLSPDIAHSRIVVGFHYLTGDVDREATGTLIDFRFWKGGPDMAFDRALLAIGLNGKHGDRDAIATSSGMVDIVECQRSVDGLWNLALYDRTRHTARVLTLRTPGGSRSFANPTVSYAPLPGGSPGIVVSVFVPQTGAARGESGELLYVRRLPLPTATAPPPPGVS